jgi:hypothetical protein
MSGALLSVTFEEGFDALHIGTELFSESILLREVSLAQSMTYLSDRMFYQCYELAEITIPKNIRIINNGAFTECTLLRTVNYAADTKLNIIASNAFLNCYSYIYIDIPESVAEIDADILFAEKYIAWSVTFNSKYPPHCVATVLTMTDIDRVYVPAESYGEYAEHFGSIGFDVRLITYKPE